MTFFERNGLEVDVSGTTDVATVVLSGELDAANSAFLVDLLATIGAAHRGGVVADVGNLELLTAAGMGAFVQSAEHLWRAGRWLRVTNPDPMSSRTLHLLGLDWLLQEDGKQPGGTEKSLAASSQ